MNTFKNPFSSTKSSHSSNDSGIDLTTMPGTPVIEEKKQKLTSPIDDFLEKIASIIDEGLPTFMRIFKSSTIKEALNTDAEISLQKHNDTMKKSEVQRFKKNIQTFSAMLENIMKGCEGEAFRKTENQSIDALDNSISNIKKQIHCLKDYYSNGTQKDDNEIYSDEAFVKAKNDILKAFEEQMQNKLKELKQAKKTMLNILDLGKVFTKEKLDEAFKRKNNFDKKMALNKFMNVSKKIDDLKFKIRSEIFSNIKESALFKKILDKTINEINNFKSRLPKVPSENLEDFKKEMNKKITEFTTNIKDIPIEVIKNDKEVNLFFNDKNKIIDFKNKLINHSEIKKAISDKIAEQEADKNICFSQIDLLKEIDNESVKISPTRSDFYDVNTKEACEEKYTEIESKFAQIGKEFNGKIIINSPLLSEGFISRMQNSFKQYELTVAQKMTQYEIIKNEKILIVERLADLKKIESKVKSLALTPTAAIESFNELQNKFPRETLNQVANDPTSKDQECCKAYICSFDDGIKDIKHLVNQRILLNFFIDRTQKIMDEMVKPRGIWAKFKNLFKETPTKKEKLLDEKLTEWRLSNLDIKNSTSSVEDMFSSFINNNENRKILGKSRSFFGLSSTVSQTNTLKVLDESMTAFQAKNPRYIKP